MPPNDPTPVLQDTARLAALEATELLDSPCEEEFDRLTRLAVRVLNVQSAAITLVAADRQFAKSLVSAPDSPTTETKPLAASYCQYVVASGAPVVVNETLGHPLVGSNMATRNGIRSYAGVPLTTSDGHTLGAFCAYAGLPRTWSENDMATLHELAELATLEIELRTEVRRGQAAEAALTQLSLRDELTGLHNRRGFLFLAEQQLRVAKRGRQRLLLVYADIDGLKAVNDTLGHAAGDAAIRAFGKAFRSTFRETDVVARLGGDEFVALALHDAAESSSAVEMLLRARLDRELVRASASPQVPVRASVGVATADPSVTEAPLDLLLAEADAALYAAKHATSQGVGTVVQTA